jgi:putative phosphoesterase
MIETQLPARAGHAARIGLIADTHVHVGQIPFPEAALAAFAGVDLIVHLGDMGEPTVLDRLGAIAPVVATRGGDDPPTESRIEPARLLLAPGAAVVAAFELGSLLAGAKSEGAVLPDGDVAARLRAAHGRAIAAVAFAATHAPALFERDGVLFVNPGSATLPASGAPTVAIVELGGGAPRGRIVELKKA